MSHAEFVHLRVHTAYSLSEGAIRSKELIALCRQHGMPAVAITDTNNLFGGMEFSSALAKAGIQPIIGCQLSVSRESGSNQQGMTRRTASYGADTIGILAQNAEGYGNLLKLLANAHVDGESRDEPQVSLATLCAHNAGLIVLTGGPAGPVGRLLVEGQREAAEAALLELNVATTG